MPNSVSAKKRVRQNADRAERNKVRRTGMRTMLRRIREAMAAGDKAGARALLPQAYQAIDKAADGHVVHRNTAANTKRRLARLVGPA